LSSGPLKILIVDDAITYRHAIKDALATFPNVEVVGTAANGQQALAKVERLNPDIVTLDIEMPIMDGIETLKALKAGGRKVQTIMVSAHTERGAKVTMEALALGAFDFITKPQGVDVKSNREHLSTELGRLLRALAPTKIGAAAPVQDTTPAVLEKPSLPFSAVPSSPRTVSRRQSLRAKIEIVAIGVSTGGPRALSQLIKTLPGDLGVPVTIVQHMPPMFTAALAASLDQESALSVVEASGAHTLEPNVVYIAPGGQHMKLEKKTTGIVGIRLTDDPPENHCRPAVDVLFRSVAKIYQERSLGVILTGMGRDGVAGLKEMKQHGVRVIGQNKATCTVYGMPFEAMRAGVVDMELPLESIAPKIAELVKRQ